MMEVEVLDPKTGLWRPLVRGISPDACQYCKDCVYVGHDHPECETYIPAPTERQY